MIASNASLLELVPVLNGQGWHPPRRFDSRLSKIRESYPIETGERLIQSPLYDNYEGSTTAVSVGRCDSPALWRVELRTSDHLLCFGLMPFMACLWSRQVSRRLLSLISEKSERRPPSRAALNPRIEKGEVTHCTSTSVLIVPSKAPTYFSALYNTPNSKCSRHQ